MNQNIFTQVVRCQTKLALLSQLNNHSIVMSVRGVGGFALSPRTNPPSCLHFLCLFLLSCRHLCPSLQQINCEVCVRGRVSAAGSESRCVCYVVLCCGINLSPHVAVALLVAVCCASLAQGVRKRKAKQRLGTRRRRSSGGACACVCVICLVFLFMFGLIPFGFGACRCGFAVPTSLPAATTSVCSSQQSRCAFFLGGGFIYM